MSGFIDLLSQWWPVPMAYLVGATPFGFLAGKMRGVDIREHGSGNIGATNVLRTLGKPIGITVLILDILKGVTPVLVARLVSEGLDHQSLLMILTAVAAIMGHNYTFWLGFKGGKGIATTAGAMIPVIPIAILVAVVLWVSALLTTRYVSVASIVAAISIPLTLVAKFILSGTWDFAILGFALFISLLAIWKHRSNIDRLRRGEENRFGTKKSSHSQPH